MRLFMHKRMIPQRISFNKVHSSTYGSVRMRIAVISVTLEATT